MAWTTDILLEMNLEGNRRMVFGKTTTDSADDDIVTGLTRIDGCLLTHSGSAVEAAASTDDGKVNVICTSGDVLFFLAIGQ
mgnify:CR=1 FL=1